MGFLLAINEASANYPGVSVLELAQEASFKMWLDARIEGGWKIGKGSTEISGIGVMIVWFIEAAIVFGAPLLLSMADAAVPSTSSASSSPTSRKRLPRPTLRPPEARQDGYSSRNRVIPV